MDEVSFLCNFIFVKCFVIQCDILSRRVRKGKNTQRSQSNNGKN